MGLCGRLLGNEDCSCPVAFSDQKTTKDCCNGFIHGSNEKCCISGSVVKNSSKLFNEWMNVRMFFTTQTLKYFTLSWSSKYWIRCHRLSFVLVWFCLVCFSFLTFYILAWNFHYTLIIISILLVYFKFWVKHTVVYLYGCPPVYVYLHCYEWLCNPYAADICCFFVFTACNFHC